MHNNIESNFLVHHKNSQHSPADMANTLQGLCEKIRHYNCHHPAQGSRVKAEVRNAFMWGVVIYKQVNVKDSKGVEKSLELEALVAEDLNVL